MAKHAFLFDLFDFGSRLPLITAAQQIDRDKLKTAMPVSFSRKVRYFEEAQVFDKIIIRWFQLVFKTFNFKLLQILYM